MVLPADQVGEAGRERLVGDEILREDRERAQEQQHAGHQDELRHRLAQQFVRLVRADQRDDAAEEERDGGVEQRDREPGREQAEDEAARLAHVMPVEARQAFRRRAWRHRAGGLQQALEDPEQHRAAMDPRGAGGQTKLLSVRAGMSGLLGCVRAAR